MLPILLRYLLPKVVQLPHDFDTGHRLNVFIHTPGNFPIRLGVLGEPSLGWPFHGPHCYYSGACV